MRTTRSSSHRGVSTMHPPRPDTPRDQAPPEPVTPPLDQAPPGLDPSPPGLGTPPVDRHTPVKTLPRPNFVAAGKNVPLTGILSAPQKEMALTLRLWGGGCVTRSGSQTRAVAVRGERATTAPQRLTYRYFERAQERDGLDPAPAQYALYRPLSNRLTDGR